MTGLTIDIVSDAVCPWCFLGKRRLEAALREIGETKAQVRWRPFQLDETIPVGGLDRVAYMSRKFPDAAQLAAAHERLSALGGEVGVAFAFDAIRRSPNTLDAHRLVRWAAAAGRQDAVVEGLFRAYFERGQDVGDNKVLVEIAEGCGMDGKDVAEGLASNRDVEETSAEIAHWRRAGVNGVPFFIFNGKLALSGAQPTATFVAAMIEARLPAARQG